MKFFLFFIFRTICITLLLLVVLDLFYTFIYLQSDQRGKIDYVYQSKELNYDVVILGSSRANNHFVTPMFKDKGLKTFNFGMSGSHLFEASLLLKLMIERKYNIKNVIIETDLNLSYQNQADGISSFFLPYIHQSKTIKNHFHNQENFYKMYFIPFFRYLNFEPRIGFREMFLSAIHKKTNHLQNLGYHPLLNSMGKSEINTIKLKPAHNKYYEEIKQICAANNINLIAIMTPMCSTVTGIDYFEKTNKIYPEIHNYESVIKGDQYFSSCGHLNDSGARKFTAVILKDFFNK